MNPDNQKKYLEFREKLLTKTVFFKNTFEEAVIKSVPGEGFFVKFKGHTEFKAKDRSEVVTEGILEYNEITEKTYNDFK